MLMITPGNCTSSGDAQTALVLFLLTHAEQLLNAAGLLGDRPAVRRTARLLADIADLGPEQPLSRRLRRELVGLHRLLSLDAVHVPDSLEAALFAEIDPASPVVEDICELTDELHKHLKALVKAESDDVLASNLAAAA